jgi:hypothetical protein
MLDLAGKIGIVTGGIRRAGWGNGKAIAVLLARRGGNRAGSRHSGIF